jgi:hypothetical protein
VINRSPWHYRDQISASSLLIRGAVKQEKVTALCCHSCVSLILLHHPLVSDFLPPPSELTARELCKNPTHSEFAGINVAEMPEANFVLLK